MANEPQTGPTDDERAELQRLRAEVAELRTRVRTRRPPGWRAVLAPVLLTLGCALLAPATVAVWLDSVVTDTDRYVATVGPLADDPAIQRAVANRVTREVMAAVDVPAVVDEAAGALAAQGAGPRVTSTLSNLSGPIAGAVEGWVHDQVGTVVASDRFADAWIQANRAAHQGLLAVMTGDDAGGAVVVEGDSVSIQLAPVIDAAKQRLVDAGFERAEAMPVVDTELVMFQSEGVERAQTWFALIDRLGTWLPLLAVALVAIGVLVARNRRGAVVGAGIGAASAMLVLGVVLTITRPLYVEALPPTVDAAAAAALFDQVVSLLRTTLRTVLAIGLSLALAGYLTGPSAHALALRRAVVRAGTLTGRWGRQNTPAAAWLRAHKRPVQVAVAAAAVLVFAFWNYPDAGVVFGILLAAGAAFAAIELVAGQAAPVPSSPPSMTNRS